MKQSPQKRLITLETIKSQLSDRTEEQRAELNRINREINKINKKIKGGKK